MIMSCYKVLASRPKIRGIKPISYSQFKNSVIYTFFKLLNISYLQDSATWEYQDTTISIYCTYFTDEKYTGNT